MERKLIMAFEPCFAKTEKRNKNENWIDIKCPLLFQFPELDQTCKKELCAWWLPIQKACAVQVLARGF